MHNDAISAPSGASRPFLRCSNSGGNWLFAGARPGAGPEPAFDPAQPGIERRHRARKIRQNRRAAKRASPKDKLPRPA